MNHNQNLLNFEVVVRIQMKDYRVFLGTKRLWIIAMVVTITKVMIWYLKTQSA